MLVLSRKLTQSIRIADDIRIQILQIHDNQVRLGIHAPSSVRIVREEVLKRENVNEDFHLVTLQSKAV